MRRKRDPLAHLAACCIILGQARLAHEIEVRCLPALTKSGGTRSTWVRIPQRVIARRRHDGHRTGRGVRRRRARIARPRGIGVIKGRLGKVGTLGCCRKAQAGHGERYHSKGKKQHAHHRARRIRIASLQPFDTPKQSHQNPFGRTMRPALPSFFAIVAACKTARSAMRKPHNAHSTRMFAVLLVPCAIRTPRSPLPAVSSKSVAAACAAAQLISNNLGEAWTQPPSSSPLARAHA